MKRIFTNKFFIISGIIILLITIFVIKSHFDTISWLDFKLEKVYMEKFELDEPIFQDQNLYLIYFDTSPVHFDHKRRIPGYFIKSSDSIITISVKTIKSVNLNQEVDKNKICGEDHLYSIILTDAQSGDEFNTDYYNNISNFKNAIQNGGYDKYNHYHRSKVNEKGRFLISLSKDSPLPYYFTIKLEGRIISGIINNSLHKYKIKGIVFKHISDINTLDSLDAVKYLNNISGPMK